MFQEYNIKHLDIDITNNCNFACKYCYHNNKTNNIDLEVLKWIKEILSKEQMKLSFLGGEPLINFKDIKNIIEDTKPKSWNMTSNLSLLNEDISNFIIRYKGKIHCSIDGDCNTQNSTRIYKNGFNTYLDVLKNIPLALKINKNATARISLTPNNVYNLYEDCISLYSKGFTKIAAMPILEMKWTEENWKEYRKQIEGISQYLLKYKKYKLKNLIDPIRFKNKSGSITKRTCGAGFNMIAISANGLFYPCHRFTKEKATEWFLGDFRHGIDKECLKLYRNYFKESRNDCRGCPCFDSCYGGCPFVSCMLNSKPNKRIDNYCKYMINSFDVANRLFNS